MSEKPKVNEIVEKHLVGFDSDLTFRQNGMDSLAMMDIMIDLELELGVSLADLDPDNLPDTVEELECIVLERMMGSP